MTPSCSPYFSPDTTCDRCRPVLTKKENLKYHWLTVITDLHVIQTSPATLWLHSLIGMICYQNNHFVMRYQVASRVSGYQTRDLIILQYNSRDPALTEEQHKSLNSIKFLCLLALCPRYHLVHNWESPDRHQPGPGWEGPNLMSRHDCWPG